MSQVEAIKVLITGGGGFVGQWVVEALTRALPAGSEILIADRAQPEVVSGDIRSASLDVTDTDSVNDLLRRERPTHILHLAAISAVTDASRDTRGAWAVNFGGTFNIALAIGDFCPGSRLVHCSSAEVYGATFNKGLPVDETAMLDPTNSYGAAKAAADIMLGQMARLQLRAIRMRPFNHTGPGQSEKFVVPAFAAQIARIERGEQEPVINVGDIDTRRDFLDVRDVADAYVKALLEFDRLPQGCAINLASGQARTVRSVLELMLAQSQVRIEVRSDPSRVRVNDTPLIVGNADRAKELLDWEPRRSWDETIRNVLNYWRERPDRA
ncbi:GDP-mannose 4,6-dehydratase [Rhodopseudomonas sp. NSM]|uniref:GDP-mannose 4,6-dehydratase n=1 Tax=Rhodopseudomonas sp. NSM TaxID=3457630 RepID=UPI004035456C